MRKGDIKLTIIELFTLLILLLNVFIKNVFSQYTLVLFLGIILFITIKLFGFEKSMFSEKKKIAISTLFYTIAFLILIYGLGLFAGYAHNSYSLKLANIVKNTFPIILLVLVSELLRYTWCKRSGKNKYYFLLTILIFVIIDTLMLYNLYDKDQISEMLKLVTVIILPSLTRNYLLTDFTRRYGYIPCIIYQLIMSLYVYLMPIIPNFSIYLESVVMFLLPLVVRYIINNNMKSIFDEDEDIELANSKFLNIFARCVSASCVILMVVIIGLCSNLFSWWIAVIATGSMTPTINVGDAVVVDKSVTKNLEQLKVGDVLVFRIKDSIFTHRIVGLREKNGRYAISTQGDRKGNAVDTWTVTNEDIIGVVKFKISYIGYPTVLLNRLIEESK